VGDAGRGGSGRVSTRDERSTYARITGLADGKQPPFYCVPAPSPYRMRPLARWAGHTPRRIAVVESPVNVLGSRREPSVRAVSVAEAAANYRAHNAE
jgi:hypothetical protein